MISYGTKPDLDKLVDSNICKNRIMAAMQNYGLDKLVYDERWEVRNQVAKQGYGLDILIKDTNATVRTAVAIHGYRLDDLINDKDANVRNAIAFQGYGLHILINDTDENIRGSVAMHGYGLDVLINDPAWSVRETVKNYLNIHNYKSIDHWAKQNIDKIHNKTKFNTSNIKNFAYKVDESSKLVLNFNYDNLDEFFENNNQLVIMTVDTKLPLITLEKIDKNNDNLFKFIVNITNANNDEFIIKTTFDSYEKFESLLQSTINALKEYKEFSIYADELEQCI